MHSTFSLSVLGLFAIALGGCNEMNIQRLDPAVSTVTRHLLDRVSVTNDGRLVAMQGNDAVLMSLENPGAEVLASYASEHFAPLVSPNLDKLISFRFAEGSGYVHLIELPSRVEKEFPIGCAVALPMKFSADSKSVLLSIFSANALGQGIIQKPMILNLTNGTIESIGVDAVVDTTGTHIITTENGLSWQSTFNKPKSKRRISLALPPIAISDRGTLAIFSRSSRANSSAVDKELLLVDLKSGAERILAIGHTAMFITGGESVVIISGIENIIRVLSLDESDETLITTWKGHNSIPVQSSNGRYFLFSRFGNAKAIQGTPLIYDAVSKSLFEGPLVYR